MLQRYIGSILLDDTPPHGGSYLKSPGGVVIPSVRTVQREQLGNRLGHLSRIREDRKPLVITVNGQYKDNPSMGKTWGAFRSALEGMTGVQFDLGTQRVYYMVDVEDCSDNPKGGVYGDRQIWEYTLKVASYEAFQREKTPTLQTLGTVAASGGTSTFSVTYPGTAFAEPTWQLSMVVPGGVTVTAVTLANTTTGESVVAPGLNLTGVTAIFLFDACSATPAQGPTNDGYGLLALSTLGYGVSLSGGGDMDFNGTIPTLIPNPLPSVPPVAYINTITASIASTGALTSTSLQVLAPARYTR